MIAWQKIQAFRGRYRTEDTELNFSRYLKGINPHVRVTFRYVRFCLSYVSSCLCSLAPQFLFLFSSAPQLLVLLNPYHIGVKQATNLKTPVTWPNSSMLVLAPQRGNMCVHPHFQRERETKQYLLKGKNIMWAPQYQIIGRCFYRVIVQLRNLACDYLQWDMSNWNTTKKQAKRCQKFSWITVARRAIQQKESAEDSKHLTIQVNRTYNCGDQKKFMIGLNLSHLQQSLNQW